MAIAENEMLLCAKFFRQRSKISGYFHYRIIEIENIYSKMVLDQWYVIISI